MITARSRRYRLTHSLFARHVHIAMGWAGLTFIGLSPVLVVWWFGVPA